MGLPTFGAQKQVLTWMIFAGVIMLGLISLFLLPVELYQGTSRGIISIIIRARGGLPPTEIERMITRLVEESVSTVSHLKNMYSNSRESESRVTLEFEPGTDMKFAALEVREKFSRVKGLLPSEIEKPVIANYQDSDSAVFIAAITSDTLSPEEIRSIVDKELKPRLDRADGVASVEIYGGRERKILVELDRDKMFAYNISVERVMDVIGASNVTLLAGSYAQGAYDFAIRTLGAFTNVNEIGDLGIKATRQRSIIPLREIATIKDAYLEPEDYARLNLSPNVSIYVKKISIANTIQVSDAVKQTIDSFSKERGDLKTIIVSEKAKLIKRAIGDVRDSLLLGMFLVTVVVYLSLGQWAISLIVCSTIPISIIGTFFFMDRLGFSMNVMTLSGLALSIGIMVDSSIVVVENAMKRKEEGWNHERAVVEGAEEMWLPLFASLLTSLCVFLPVMFVDKEVQLVYQSFAFTVSIALTLALIVAIMLVPLLFLKSENLLNRKQAVLPYLNQLRQFWKTYYDRYLKAIWSSIFSETKKDSPKQGSEWLKEVYGRWLKES
ncbi:MAG TPA: efflux RND transporter permease subunit, partial [Candidatus Omnitrophota bacterium]|nr:efflux RND transporter permease subunit [Candidatus Omnitrophota bacterium]